VILSLSVVTQYRRVTDTHTQTDTDTPTAYTALDISDSALALG